MATGFLPVIFRFKTASTACFLILTLNLVLCSKVYAAPWFAVKGSGVLSRQGIVNNNIPTSGLPAGFNSSVVQPGGGTENGSLVSAGGITVNTSDDAYIENVGTNYYDGTYPSLAGLTVYTISSLSNLNPNQIYQATDTTTLEGILSATNYSLTSEGLVLIFVAGGGSLDLNQKLIATGTNPDRKRLLLITNQRIIFRNNASTSGATFNSPSGVQAGLLSYFSSSGSLSVLAPSGNSFILEGPIAGFGNLVLQHDAGVFPGVYVKYNPFYVAELSKKGVNGLAIKGLLESKTSWRYD